MIAQTPPMGWNSWNTFGSDIDEALIRETADAMGSLGYRDAGYEYVVIDDCWALRERDKDGYLVADPAKFPHGMKALADYVHSKGLKFGMYSCAGLMTCAGYPSSYGYEYRDAETFASFGVDYLKYDFCFFPESGNGRQAYRTMAMALRATGREILFSACNWGREEPWRWMRSAGAHMYRSTGDIHDTYASFTEIVKSQADNFCMSAPGCYNDIDMLTVGMYGKGLVGREGCNDAEYRSQFSLWCLFGAPLMMGGDIRSLSEESRILLQCPGLLAIHRDEECRPPYQIGTNSSFWYPGAVYAKLLSGGDLVIAAYNQSDKDTVPLTIPFAELGIPNNIGRGLDLTNVLTGEHIGVVRDYYRANVQKHDCLILRATPTRL